MPSGKAYSTTSRSSSTPNIFRVFAADGTTVVSENGYSLLSEAQVMSRGNDYRQLGKSAGDIGGSFATDRTFYKYGSGNVSMVRSNQSPRGDYYFADGQVWCQYNRPTPPIWGPGDNWDPESKRAYLAPIGATAIARTLPTNSNASIAVTLGELKRDGLPHLVGRDLLRERCSDYRTVGSEYLNVEFGWKPFVNDLKKMSKSVIDSDKIMQRYYAEANRPIHRNLNLNQYDYSATTVPQVSTFDTLLGYIDGADIFGGWEGRRGQLTTWYTGIEKVWFSGEFLYYAGPRDDSVMSKLNEYRTKADILYGLNLDPETLWNLAPWTWMGDWFSNVGDIIHNVNSYVTDGPVLRYGYIMYERTQQNEYRLEGINLAGATSSSMTVGSTRKYRFHANPFGFGSTFESLTERQIGILIALGLTKGKRSY